MAIKLSTNNINHFCNASPSTCNFIFKNVVLAVVVVLLSLTPTVSQLAEILRPNQEIIAFESQVVARGSITQSQQSKNESSLVKDRLLSQRTIEPTNKNTRRSPSTRPSTTPRNMRPTRRPNCKPLTMKPTNRPTRNPRNMRPTRRPNLQPRTMKPTNRPTRDPRNMRPTHRPNRQPRTMKPTTRTPTTRAPVTDLRMMYTNKPTRSPRRTPRRQ